MQDLISVIVPIYRVEDYLEECIQSIINQTYKNLEIILVDDGSDDGCGEICDRFSQMDARIKVIHQENQGVSKARKNGVLAATGKYVGFVDGDDWVDDSMYEALHLFAVENDVEVVESGVIDAWNDAIRLRAPYLAEGVYKGDVFKNEIEPHFIYSGKFFRYGLSPYLCSKLFKRQQLLKYQMEEDDLNRVADDFIISMPYIAESKSIYISHDCYYYYRVRANSAKRSKDVEFVKRFINSKKQLRNRFQNTSLILPHDKQLDYFTMYWLIMNGPYVFDNAQEEVILVPFGGISCTSKVILYGAGAVGIHLHTYLEKMGVKIVAWLDGNYKSLQSVMNVNAPEEINNYEYDYVVISVLREETVRGIEANLKKLGVPDNKVLWIQEKYLQNPDLLLNKIGDKFEEA